MLSDIWKQLVNHAYPALLLTALTVLAWPAIRSGEWRQRLRTAVRREGWLVLFLFYTALVVTSTVLVRTHVAHPLRSVFKHFGPGDAKWNRHIVENVLLFIPYTVLGLRAIPSARPMRRAALMSAGLTLFIELSQLIFHLGDFQVSDLVHNMAGGLIGGGIWLGLRALSERRRPQKRT